MTDLSNFENISVVDHRKDEGYVTPVEAAGEDKVYVSRIREDHTIDNGLNMWVVSDNLLKGLSLSIFFVCGPFLFFTYLGW